MGIELANTPASSGGFNSSSLILILIVVVAVYMLMIRPQQRRRQQQAQQQNTIGPGARVRTTAGLYATVVAVDGDDVILEVAPGVESRYMRRAIMDVVSPADADEQADAETDADESGADETDAAETDAAEADPEYTVADDAPAPADAEHDDEESAYEKATGTKKD
jgi:preprotein translocase subunit YajC